MIEEAILSLAAEGQRYRQKKVVRTNEKLSSCLGGRAAEAEAVLSPWRSFIARLDGIANSKLWG